jgi:Tfp pilus assembly protein PilF
MEALRDKSVDKYMQAEHPLKKAVRYDPSFTDAKILLAKIYLALGDREKARELAISTLKISNDSKTTNEAKSILNQTTTN